MTGVRSWQRQELPSADVKRVESSFDCFVSAQQDAKTRPPVTASEIRNSLRRRKSSFQAKNCAAQSSGRKLRGCSKHDRTANPVAQPKGRRTTCSADDRIMSRFKLIQVF